MKGYRDKDGNPLTNAHLLGVFHRVLKLLNYGVKPVFVFDGGVPHLKRQTLASRRQKKLDAVEKSEITRKKLVTNLLKRRLERELKLTLPPSLRMSSKIDELSSPKKTSPRKAVNSQHTNQQIDEDLEEFRLKFEAASKTDGDRMTNDVADFEDSSSSSAEEDTQNHWHKKDYSENFSTIISPHFDSLPLETQHEILFDMQESRKMNSWGKIDQMPKNLGDFSTYQMDRLRKRTILQKKIQSVQKEMGQRHIHVQDLEDLLSATYNEGKDEIIGSVEKGCVMIKTNSKENSSGDKNMPGTSTQQTSVEIQDTMQGITIDDFAEWSSSDEEKVESIKNFPKSTQNRPVDELGEDEQLAVAIQMSLSGDNSESKSENIMPESSVANIQPFDIRSSSCSSSSEDENTANLSENLDLRKKRMSVKDLKSKSDGAEIISVLQAESSYSQKVAKFLDAVKFSEQAPVEFKKISDDSSSEEDDFTEVKCTDEQIFVPTKEEVLSIVIDKNSLLRSPPEDDIFADIFVKDENKEENLPVLSKAKDAPDEIDKKDLIAEEENKEIATGKPLESSLPTSIPTSSTKSISMEYMQAQV